MSQFLFIIGASVWSAGGAVPVECSVAAVQSLKQSTRGTDAAYAGVPARSKMVRAEAFHSGLFGSTRFLAYNEALFS